MQCTVISVFVLGALGVVMGENLDAQYDGQPGCLIRYEFDHRYWPNNFDRHAYWECQEWGVGAVRHECPPNMSFQASELKCVPDSDWQKTPYSEPPTRPGYTSHDQCEPFTPCPTTESTTTTPYTTTTTTTTPCTTTTTTPCTTTTTTEPAPYPTDTTPPCTTTSPKPCTTCPTDPTRPPPTPEPFPVDGECPGAAQHQYEAGPHSCEPPPCTAEQWLKGTLLPTRDPTKFFQCGPGVGNLFIMPCAPGTCFSFDHQVCVHNYDWKNPCTNK
ncbi:integumentary mucin C.1-like [Phlebotomus papatasi]|uniref:Uncharacterized protein n=1 Tax=Phlebotomus papatasi TaxID=29031 RepID=A0A1B0DQE9_PHLPP|nr:integumentary mucin C.1-like [Phlebotomus papatasi]